MANQGIVEFTSNFLVALLVPCIFPETLVSIVIIFFTKETFKFIFIQNFGKITDLSEIKTKNYQYALIASRFFFSLLSIWQLYDVQKNSDTFMVNTENQPTHKWDHLDVLVDSLRSVIKFFGIPLELGILELIPQNGHPLNLLVKLPFGLFSWYIISQYYNPLVINSYHIVYLSAVLLVFIGTIYEFFTFKEEVDIEEKEKSKKKQVELEPSFEKRKILLYLSLIFENISVLKCNEVFLLFLICNNSDIITMTIALFIFTLTQTLEREPRIDDLDWTSIIFKLIQVGLFYAGNQSLQTISSYRGEEEVINGTKYTISILLFLLSELVRVIFLFNSKIQNFNVQRFGKYIVYFIFYWYSHSTFQTMKFYTGISTLSSMISFGFFFLFVIFKPKK